jgi:peptidoglycan/xylan/chitin deacetylase (PgdA/CDA1 family)
MYHRIANEPFDPWKLAVPPERFREHLSWFAENRKVMTLGELVECQRRSDLSDNAVAVTFDDGYACNAEIAAPLLEKFRIPATIFLPVRLIERGRPFWWDELECIVLEHEGTSLNMDGQEFAIGERKRADRHWCNSSRTPRQVAFRKIHARLLMKSTDDVDIVMEDLRRQSPHAKVRSPQKRPMSPEQVRSIASSLVEFGSHTLTHPWLPALNFRDQAREIGESIERCRDLSGRYPIALAYPFGVFNHDSLRLAKQAGFSCACTTEDVAVASTSNLFALPRVQVGNSTAAQLARRLATL